MHPCAFQAASGYGSYGSYRFGVPESEPTLDVLEEQLAEAGPALFESNNKGNEALYRWLSM